MEIGVVGGNHLGVLRRSRQSREETAHREVEDQVERMVEVVPGLVDGLVAQREREVGRHVGVLVLVEVHSEGVGCPQEREEMEVALHAVGCFAHAGAVGVMPVVERLAPVGSTVEIAVLQPLVYAVFVPHFHDVYLAALGPYYPALCCQGVRLLVYGVVIAKVSSEVVTQHPECGPQAIGSIGEGDTRLHFAVLHQDFVLRVEPRRGSGTVAVVLAAGRQHQATLARYRMALYADIARGVVLHLCVTAAAGVIVDVPIGFVERLAFEVVLPEQGVRFALATAKGSDQQRKGYVTG